MKVERRDMGNGCESLNGKIFVQMLFDVELHSQNADTVRFKRLACHAKRIRNGGFRCLIVLAQSEKTLSITKLRPSIAGPDTDTLPNKPCCGCCGIGLPL